MINQINKMYSRSPHVVWVTTISPSGSLDSATWLDTTEELRRIGWNVSLLCKEHGGRQNVRGIEVLNIAGRDVYLLGQVLFHWNALKYILKNRENVDVVFFHQHSALWLLPLSFIRLFSKKTHLKLVMDTRDLFDPVPGSLKVQLQIWFDHFSRWLANLYLDGQTAITLRMAQLVSIPKDDLWGVWPSGVDPQTFKCAVENRQWPGENDEIRLIYVGRLLRKRNLQNLFEAVKRVNSEGMPFVFHVYGDGKDRSMMEQIVGESGGCVQIHPPVSFDQVPDLLAKSHIGVTSLPVSSDLKYGASSPIKLFEYMAAGMPMLATANPCHLEVVKDGGYVFWVDEPTVECLSDALRKAWVQRAALPVLGEEAAMNVENWTWAAAARKVSNAFLVGLR